ncbi:chemotaxis protein CheD, partial [Candidatus Parcubacteria bacterium]|nr:chemotaxis protein CheD [Candidatus Parcubacteria bacterium]
QRNIPIAARDVGGDFGRIVEFDVKTGQMYIKTISGDRKVI